jgi:hypothetical protein
MVMRDLATSVKIFNQVLPVDTNAQLQGGNFQFVSLRNYQGGAFLIQVGVHSGDATAFTISQAKNVEGNGSKAMTAHIRGYKNVPGSSPIEESDRWDEFVITSGTFDIAASTNYVIPIRPAMLDVTNDFDCIRMALGLSSAATLFACQLMLWGGPEGLAGDIRHIPSAAVNRMPN